MSWFTPKCPVDAETKDWLDEAFIWLTGEFGAHLLQEVDVVLPTEEHFPDAYDGTRTSIRRMFERVCGYMKTDIDSIELRFYDSEEDQHLHPLATEERSITHDLGSYLRRSDGRDIVRLDVSQSRNPVMMVATIAHELAHVILLGDEHIDPGDPDNEPMADLFTVFSGLGVFNANTTVIFEQWTNAQYQGWRVGGGGYLREEDFGYALALFAYSRSESKPEWASYLNTNVRSYFKTGLNYLNKTGDTKVARISAQKAVAS